FSRRTAPWRPPPRGSSTSGGRSGAGAWPKSLRVDRQVGSSFPAHERIHHARIRPDRQPGESSHSLISGLHHRVVEPPLLDLLPIRVAPDLHPWALPRLVLLVDEAPFEEQQHPPFFIGVIGDTYPVRRLPAADDRATQDQTHDRHGNHQPSDREP